MIQSRCILLEHPILVLKTYIYIVYVNKVVSLRRTDNYSVIFFLLFLFI